MLIALILEIGIGRHLLKIIILLRTRKSWHYLADWGRSGHSPMILTIQPSLPFWIAPPPNCQHGICPGNSLFLHTPSMAIVDWSRGWHPIQARPVRAFPSFFQTKSAEERKHLSDSESCKRWNLGVLMTTFPYQMKEASLQGEERTEGREKRKEHRERATRGHLGPWHSAAPELFLWFGCSHLLSFMRVSCVTPGPVRS